MPNLEKVPGERNLYRNPASETYFLRVTKPKDNFISLGTKLKTEAIQRVDARRAAAAAAKLGIALAPEEAKKTLEVTAVIKQYENDGYPDRRSTLPCSRSHRRRRIARNRGPPVHGSKERGVGLAIALRGPYRPADRCPGDEISSWGDPASGCPAGKWAGDGWPES
jgi:hypothetical protein